MQPVCPHEQSMSGVFSIASHWVLQYLPDVVTHEQTGCAHFSAFAVAISFLLASDRQRVIQGGILNTWEKRFCPIKDISQCLVAARSLSFSYHDESREHHLRGTIAALKQHVGANGAQWIASPVRDPIVF